MRDVSPDSNSIHKSNSGESILHYFFYFFRSPFKKIQFYPDFPFHKVLTLQLVFQLIILLISIAAAESKIPLAVKVISLPIFIFIFHYFLCLMTRLYFQVTENKKIKFTRLWGFLFFCLLPVHIASAFSTHVPALSVIMFITSLFLMITGLVENFSIAKKGAMIYAAALFTLYLSIFIIQHKMLV